MKITGYTIVEGKNITDLEKAVSDFIKDDWQPVGGIVINTKAAKGTAYYQAMVDLDDSDKFDATDLHTIEGKLDDILDAVDKLRKATLK